MGYIVQILVINDVEHTIIIMDNGETILLYEKSLDDLTLALGILAEEKECLCPEGTCQNHWHEYEDI